MFDIIHDLRSQVFWNYKNENERKEKLTNMLSNASRFWLLASADILGCARKYLPNINFLVLLENFRNINQKIFDFWTKLYVRFCFVTQTEKLRMLNFVEPWHGMLKIYIAYVRFTKIGGAYPKYAPIASYCLEIWHACSTTGLQQ